MKVILFDGVCNLCNGFVNFILERDQKGVFKFASLQSDYAKNLLGEESETELNTVIFYDGNQFYRKSEAVFQIIENLAGYRWLKMFRFIPRRLSDGIYDLVAKNRYRIFGKSDSCRIPTQELLQRFYT